MTLLEIISLTLYHKKRVKTAEAPKKVVSITLPYLGEERCGRWKRLIKRYVESVYPAARVVFYWKTTKAFYVSQKDRLPDKDMPGVVYYFACACSENYVGRTECCLKERIGQHIPAWLGKGDRSRPRSNKPPESAITRHLMFCNHHITDAKNVLKSFIKVVTTILTVF